MVLPGCCSTSFGETVAARKETALKVIHHIGKNRSKGAGEAKTLPALCRFAL